MENEHGFMCENGNEDQDWLEYFREEVKAAWPYPSTVDSLRFVYQELGEFDSVLMHMGHGDKEYVRNHTKPDDLKKAMMLEFGQVYMMILTLASKLGICVSCALALAINHQERKIYRNLADKLDAGESLTSKQKLLLDDLP